MEENFSEAELIIRNNDERIIPRITHDNQELIRHRSSYMFFKKIIENDIINKNVSFPIKILDIGCGVGHGCYLLSDIPGSEIVGIDISSESIEYAKNNYQNPNISYYVVSLEYFLLDNKEFDYIVSRHSIEHISDGIFKLKELKWKNRLLTNVPFDEPKGKNIYHLVDNIKKEHFLSIFPEAEIFYEDLRGITYNKLLENPKPNSIICICSNKHLLQIKEMNIEFPIPEWKDSIEYLNLENKYNQLQSEYNYLQERNNQLQNEYNSLQRTSNQTNNLYASLQNDYELLREQNNVLQNNYSYLQEQNSLLQKNYNSLYVYCSQLQESSAIKFVNKLKQHPILFNITKLFFKILKSVYKFFKKPKNQITKIDNIDKSFNPKVSIIIPVYNGSNYLKEAINSAIKQTYKNIEIIVVNDGSNDGGKTEAISKSYGNKIRYFSKENGGVATALNMGIENSTGEYISWLSHDDLYKPNKVKTQIEYLSIEQDKNVIFYSDYDIIDDNKHYIKTIKVYPNYFYDRIVNLLYLLFLSTIHGCALLIPKKCFIEIGLFDEQFKTTQDYVMWLKILKKGYQFKYIQEALILTRQHKEQGTKTLINIHVKEVEELYISACDLFKETFNTLKLDELKIFEQALIDRSLIKSPAYFNEQFIKKDENKTLLTNNYLTQKEEKSNRKKILLIAMTTNIHTVRWINKISDQNWDIHLFPSTDIDFVHPSMKGATVHKTFRGFEKRVEELTKLIETLKPDVVHSLEFQFAGYLALEVKKLFKDNFPKWIVTNWGHDIFLFGQLPEHKNRIREILALCDFYSCECHRDVELALKYGLKGKVFPVFPNAGGFDIEKTSELRKTLPSKRKIIMLKGYQHWYGRALCGLRALERCKELLNGYELVIYLGENESIFIASELFSQSTGIPVRIIPYAFEREQILELHSKARISIGLSISDGVSTSFIETIAMGSFPIQSYTACANEWVTDGETAFLVHPEDPEEIEQAIRKALTDDKLVDDAYHKNWLTVKEKLDENKLKEYAIQFYNI